MKLKWLLLVTICVTSCGFKGPPTPIFPTSQNQIDEEIKRRDNEHRKAEKLNNSIGDQNETK